MRFALDLATPPPPPPPSPPPPFQTLTSNDSGHYSPSLLLITAILAFVVIVTGCINLLLRFVSRSSSSSSSSSAAPSLPDRDHKAAIDSLPIFSLAYHSLAAIPNSSPDCAVCLSAFRLHEELRLLPACRHAFHATCIDTWLRSSPSCPLCRCTIAGSGTSFRMEIGSVSRWSTPPPEEDPTTPPPHARSYSLGSSFEYVAEDEVEAVLARLRRMTEKEEKEEEAVVGAPPSPGAEVGEAEAAVGAGRGWLKEYVDRLASSASSSFNSLRFSGRWSHRFGGGGGVDGESWDFDMEEYGFSTFYRWLTGV